MSSTPDDGHLPVDSEVHHALTKSFIDRGHPLQVSELAQMLNATPDEIEASLRRLEANHGVVLHPGTSELWVMHPFSTTPTLFYVANADRGWWSPCIWCALGVATLVEGPVTIESSFGGEGEPCTVTYDDGVVTPAGLLAHFPITVARAWDNVHRHCACTLVFRDTDSIDAWCTRHGIDRGEVVPLDQVARLAQLWYGNHLAPDWRKATAEEAATTFRNAGLTSPHWHVPTGDPDQRF